MTGTKMNSRLLTRIYLDLQMFFYSFFHNNEEILKAKKASMATSYYSPIAQFPTWQHFCTMSESTHCPQIPLTLKLKVVGAIPSYFAHVTPINHDAFPPPRVVSSQIKTPHHHHHLPPCHAPCKKTTSLENYDNKNLLEKTPRHRHREMSKKPN